MNQSDVDKVNEVAHDPRRRLKRTTWSHTYKSECKEIISYDEYHKKKQQIIEGILLKTVTKTS